MTSPFQNSPFLRQQRAFPQDSMQVLTTELDKAYIDTATKVNARTIGVFALNNAITTGEAWYLTGQPNKQQTLRKLFSFTSTGNIAHGITFSQITGFTRCYGQYTDGSNWYGLIFASNTSIAGQNSFYVTTSNIVIAAGAGAPPTISTGWVILEWLVT